MFSPKKLLLPGVLVSLLSLSVLAGAATPVVKEAPTAGTEAKAGEAVTFDALVQMLQNLGYDVTVKTSDNGFKTCLVKFQQEGWSFEFTVSLSGDQSVIWISAYLGRIPEGDKIQPEALLKLLQLNGSTGTAKFVASNGYLYLYMPIDNSGLTPSRLRKSIEIMAGNIKSTAAAWNTGAWTAAGKDAAAFKAKIDGQYRKLADAVAEFAKALKPIFEGGPVDREQLKKAHAQVLQTLREVRASVKALQVPNTPAAREMVEACQQLCEVYESMFTTELAEVIRIIEDETINAGDRLAKIQAVLQTLVKKEDAARKAVQTAQEKFKKEYGNV